MVVPHVLVHHQPHTRGFAETDEPLGLGVGGREGLLGENAPDPAGPGGGGPRGGFGGFSRDPKTQAAFQKCRSLLPFGPGGPGGRPGDAPATTTAAK